MPVMIRKFEPIAFKQSPRRRSPFVVRMLQVTTTIAALLSVASPCASQDNSTNTSARPAATSQQKSESHDVDPERSAIHFGSVGKRSTQSPTVSRLPSPQVFNSTATAPLSTSDYKNYLNSDWSNASPAAKPQPVPPAEQSSVAKPVWMTQKNLDPITPVDAPANPGQVSDLQTQRDIVLGRRPAGESEVFRVASNAPPSAPAMSNDAALASQASEAAASTEPAPSSTLLERAKAIIHSLSLRNPLATTPKQNAKAPVNDASNENSAAAMVNDNSSAVTSPPISQETVSRQVPDTSILPNQPSTQAATETELNVVGTQPVEFRPVALAQAPVMPKPEPTPTETKVETKVEPQHVQTDPIPMAGSNEPPTALTTPSYLPANPEGYCFRYGVKCPPCGCNPGGPGWAAARPIPWEVFAQGEYVGPARLAHVPIYRLRVDDQLAFVYRLSGQVSGQPYRLNVRDRIVVQSQSAPEVMNREVIVQPDGTITLPFLGQVRASGATLVELSKQLDEQFKSQIKDPRITVIPVEMNSNLQELRSSVDRRYGQGGQVSDARISPDGTVQLPAIGLVPAQGLTLEELEREIKARYARIVEGLEVTPILTQRAPRFVYVVGEVRLPGRYAMEGPTTLMQAIAMAGSWNVGAGLNEVVVFRRDENWQLMATKLNIRTSLLLKHPCPEGEIWLRDSDVVLVPKSPILCADDVINLVFTRGIYGVFPMTASLNFTKASSL
jgi:polysaccharide biosynthesis/export protein